MFDGCGETDGELRATGAEVMGELVAVDAAIKELTFRRLRLLGELHAVGTTDVVEGMRTAAWWARTTGLPYATARSEVRVAAELHGRFGVLRDALEAGRVGFDHVRVVVAAANPRVTDDLVGLQGELVAIAEGTVFEHWRHQVLALVELLDQDGTTPGHAGRPDPGGGG